MQNNMKATLAAFCQGRFLSFSRHDAQRLFDNISTTLRFRIFSCITLLGIALLLAIAFIVITQKFGYLLVSDQLAIASEDVRLRLATTVNSEIALAKKMSDSPIIQKYFMNPSDARLKQHALDELESYRKHFANKLIFWINDIDKIFYRSDKEPYHVDPSRKENYWYNMTLYETDTYNINVNYNPDLNETDLWVNAPVFADDKKPVGMLGAPIKIDDILKSVIIVDDTISLFIFNKFSEIKISKDRRLISGDVLLADHLGKVGEQIISVANNMQDADMQFFIHDGSMYCVSPIPLLHWHLVCSASIKFITLIDAKFAQIFIFILILSIVIVVIFNIYVAKMNKTIASQYQELVLAHDQAELAKGRAEAANEALISNLIYASNIQKNLLPRKSVFQETFADHSIIWEPKDIVSGDIYWTKTFDEGAVLCVCDCTGHGTSGALLTMLVVATLEATVTSHNYKDTADIIWELEKRLVSVLHVGKQKPGMMNASINDGCDLAVLYAAKDGSVAVSTGNTQVFVCDGKSVTRFKGQRIQIGDGTLRSKDDIKIITIPANPDNKFYIASDGLYDQIGGESGLPFGYSRFKQIILDMHNENQTVISDAIWEAFETYRDGQPRRDDFLLIACKP